MLGKSKRLLSVILCLCLIFVFMSGVTTADTAQKEVKNVIILIPDGMSMTHATIARWYKGGTPLAMDEMASGLVKTYSTDNPITDSAPAATAYATGVKSQNGYLSVLPSNVTMPGLDTDTYQPAKKPLATVLEGAKLLKKSTGLIVTCEIPHATPAAFSSHIPARKPYDTIIEQQVYEGIDVVFGGGSDCLVPGSDPNNRKDGENLINVLKAKGYDYVTTRDQMLKSTSDKIWGMFAPMAMSYDIDRDADVQPGIAEMTKKAISVLSKNEKGFFLMVEGSKIDWAAHANDPIGVISDVLAFDDAVKEALDFARKDGNTAVIVCADHGNGGMTIGAGSTSAPSLNAILDPLKKARLTGEGLESKIKADKSNVTDVIAEYYGITDLTKDEIKAISNAKAGTLNSVVGPMLSKRSFIGWTTTEHTGEEVILYVYHPGNYKPTGTVENAQIGRYTAEILGINLDELNRTLFVDAGAAFELKGIPVNIDMSDVNNPVAVVTKGKKTLRLPINKNIGYLDHVRIEFKGLTILTDRVYIPQEVVDRFK